MGYCWNDRVMQRAGMLPLFRFDEEGPRNVIMLIIHCEMGQLRLERQPRTNTALSLCRAVPVSMVTAPFTLVTSRKTVKKVATPTIRTENFRNVHRVTKLFSVVILGTGNDLSGHRGSTCWSTSSSDLRHRIARNNKPPSLALLCAVRSALPIGILRPPADHRSLIDCRTESFKKGRRLTLSSLTFAPLLSCGRFRCCIRHQNNPLLIP